MGRPRKRGREGTEADDPSNDHLNDSDRGNFHIEPSTPGNRQPLSQDLDFDRWPIEDVSDLLNGSSNDIFDGGVFSYPVEPDAPIQTSNWDLSQNQDGTSAWQSTGPSNTDPMGLLLNLQTLRPTGSSGTHVSSGSEGGCSCLTGLYSTLSSFQSLPPSSFPFSMGALTKATKVARDACQCEQCPTQYASALQNLMLLSTLLPLIAHEYGKLLAHVDDRASKGGTMILRMGEKDKSLEDLHRHTYELDCPMAFEMELSAAEWRSMARKAMKTKVLGPVDVSVIGVVNDLESRQKRWHEHPTLIEFHHGKPCKEHGSEVGEEHTCLQMLDRVKGSIRSLSFQ